MWSPLFDFVNGGGGDFKMSVEGYDIRTDPPGWTGLTRGSNPNETWVVFNGRKQGQFAAELDLREFPFDQQIARVVLESEWKNNTLVWRPAPQILDGLEPPGLVVDGWAQAGVDVKLTNFYYPVSMGTASRP